mgnify:CR=1 FL=1
MCSSDLFSQFVAPLLVVTPFMGSSTQPGPDESGHYKRRSAVELTGREAEPHPCAFRGGASERVRLIDRDELIGIEQHVAQRCECELVGSELQARLGGLEAVELLEVSPEQTLLGLGQRAVEDQ